MFKLFIYLAFFLTNYHEGIKSFYSASSNIFVFFFENARKKTTSCRKGSLEDSPKHTGKNKPDQDH